MKTYLTAFAVFAVLLAIVFVLRPQKNWVMYAYPRASENMKNFQIETTNKQANCEDLGHDSVRLYGGSYVCILE